MFDFDYRTTKADLTMLQFSKLNKIINQKLKRLTHHERSLSIVHPQQPHEMHQHLKS
jgi:hypothetical protein